MNLLKKALIVITKIIIGILVIFLFPIWLPMFIIGWGFVLAYRLGNKVWGL